MKKLKYIPLIRIILFLASLCLILSFKKQSAFLVLIPILIDLSISFYLYQNIKRKEKEKSLVFVVHRRSWNSGILKPIWIIAAIGLLSFLIFAVKVEGNSAIGIFIPFYVIVAGSIFYNGFDGYVFNKTGILQPNFLDLNYNWDEIEQISVEARFIKYTIRAKKYKTKINKEQIPKIVSFLDSIGKNYSA